MKSDLEQLFLLANQHVLEHKCSAHPYADYLKLEQYLHNYRPSSVLEIGTGTGFITSLILQTLPEAEVISIEKNAEHCQSAQKFISLATQNINYTILNEIAEEALGQLPDNSYDFIFFDGFQVHYEFLPHYERLLKKSGILFLANNHLTSKTSEQFFTELSNESRWQILEKFNDTTVARKI